MASFPSTVSRGFAGHPVFNRTAFAASVLTGLVATLVTAGDHGLMHRVHRWRAPRWLRVWMIAATRGGDGWLWYGMAMVVALYGGPERFQALGASVVATAVGVALFLKLKRAFGRKRPCHLEPHCWAKLLPPDQFSFPSGHTITAFAVAVSLSDYYPEMQPGLYFCAASIAASRILLGMHFLSDVVAGAAVGALLGSVAAESMRWAVA